MKDFFQLTVSDILKRNHFENSIVLARKNGLHRIVRWVHVVEVTNIRNLLNGKELILSTGVAWKEDEDVFVSIIQQLIATEAAGLCIEVGTYLSEIPQEVIRIANEQHFPIIIFKEEVPFVAITQDIHAMIINEQYRKISDLENYSQSLNKQLLTTENYEDILHFISSALEYQIIFKLKGQEYEFIPEIDCSERIDLINKIEQTKIASSSQLAFSPIHLFGQEYAELYIFSNEIPISEYDLLILDRTSTALAQHLLRDLYVGEKKRAEEFEWLHGWLEGEHQHDSIMDYLIEHGIKPKSTEAVVLNVKMNSYKENGNQDGTYIKLLFRSIFEQYGFAVFSVEKRNEIVFILLNNRPQKNMKERIKKALLAIKESEFMKKKNSAKIPLAAGKFVCQLTEVHKSYDTAKETLRIQQEMSKKETYHFYEDLHLYRLISQMSKHVDLQELVLEYLHPVIENDRKYNGKLLETLKVYLECNGSKQETANKLFIVRQTLYHRLQKLENLLGNDFMEHEKRVALEFMLLVTDYLSPSILYQHPNSSLID